MRGNFALFRILVMQLPLGASDITTTSFQRRMLVSLMLRRFPAGLKPIWSAISTALSLNLLSKLDLEELFEAGIIAEYKYSE